MATATKALDRATTVRVAEDGNVLSIYADDFTIEIGWFEEDEFGGLLRLGAEAVVWTFPFSFKRYRDNEVSLR
jgi:hypothetical protein